MSAAGVRAHCPGTCSALRAVQIVSRCLLVAWLLLPASAAPAADQAPLPGTAPLEIEADFAALTVAGVDRFLLRAIDQTKARRQERWKRSVRDARGDTSFAAENRRHLARMIGLFETQPAAVEFEFLAPAPTPRPIVATNAYSIWGVRWPVAEGITGEGLLVEPAGRPVLAGVVAIADCKAPPEALVGLTEGIPDASRFALRLAERGARVLVPALIDRQMKYSTVDRGRRAGSVTHREFLYRAAYQMGRHLIGYEVARVLAGARALRAADGGSVKLAVVGHGEGALLALYAGALDPQIDAVGASGYFQPREKLFTEPIDRNVFGLLERFGDAEIAALIAPRTLVIEAAAIEEFTIPSGLASAPATLSTAPLDEVRAEFARLESLFEQAPIRTRFNLVVSEAGAGPPGSAAFIDALCAATGLVRAPEEVVQERPEPLDRSVHIERRSMRQFSELASLNEQLIDESHAARHQFMQQLETSKGLEAYVQSTAAYRRRFQQEILGQFEEELLPPNPRTRLKYDEEGFRGHEVLLDLFPDVVLYGILLVPANVAAGKRRPVVVCQHGLDGRAEHTIEGDRTSYRDFAARLARRGFVTFSPQHLYQGGDAFRALQRKANPLGKSLFSIMVAQHQQLLRWLGELPFVDASRIAFYGISYGGKSAMRIPAVLEGYCLSICSSDFSDWIWRTVSGRHAGGYLAHAEYEIFEFNLGNTFNYAEMAALICPRPFMVESFHRQGLFVDKELREFAKVRHIYELLELEGRVERAYYGSFAPPAPHQERQTFQFLHRHLNWPEP
jgi:dienelactone hydrolase